MELLAGHKEDIIRALVEDRNAFPINYIKACGITIDDLLGRITDSRGNVRDEVLLGGWNEIPKGILLGKAPAMIPKGNTEVYFWGLPSSGRCCIMTAIINHAHMSNYNVKYTESLYPFIKFEGAVKCLPFSDHNFINYVPICLNSENISLIKIPGNMINTFIKKTEGLQLNSVDEGNYELLISYLQNKDNPKYHFFCIDSILRDPDVRMYNKASLFFQESGIFNKATKGIHLIVTKCDLLSPNKDEWGRIVVEFITKYYDSFVESLKKIVSPINGLGLTGCLRIFPFSMGEVFFQQLCLFDPSSADSLLRFLMPQNPNPKRSWRWHLTKIFNS